jgi:precorrin-2 dehydrogenase / sirohydrochlorin ferrochelatase
LEGEDMPYPIFLDVKGRSAVIIGGGKVAARKAAGLLEEGAKITVVSPALAPELQHFLKEGQITWVQKTFSPDDLMNAFLVFAATNSREINLQVKIAAKDGQLVNIADAPDASDFQIPSNVKRGKLTIAISTSGASPTLARKIRRDLEQKYDESYQEAVDFLHRCRKSILAELEDPGERSKLLAMISEEDFWKKDDREDRFRVLLKEIKNQ